MSEDPWLIEYARQYASHCPVCRRPLGELREPRCPHCQIGLTLGLATVQPHLLAWGLVIGGAGITAGLASFLGFISLINDMESLRQPAMRIVIALGPIMIIALAAALAGRHRFCRWPRAIQWSLAIASLLIAAIAVFTFSANFT